MVVEPSSVRNEDVLFIRLSLDVGASGYNQDLFWKEVPELAG